MYIHGTYYNAHGEEITIHILTNGDRRKEVVIGADGGDLFFTDDPCEITTQVNDTFDHLLTNQASVRILCRNFVPEFFCKSVRDAVVNIYREDRCLFAGYVVPQTYSQGYNEEFDEVELTCVDALLALHYFRYRNVGSPGVSYAIAKYEADKRTFFDVMKEMLGEITAELDIVGGNDFHYYYDRSKKETYSAPQTPSLIERLAISDLLFLGKQDDEVWQQDEVMAEMLKYLNLHITQDGFDFYIFSWESVKSDDSIHWNDLLHYGNLTTNIETIDITSQNVTDCDTTITLGEVFNQIQLTCDVNSIESVIESPLDDSLLSTPYTNKQLYMTEYVVDDCDKDAIDAWDAMVHGRTTRHDKGRIVDWYVQVMNNPQWTFPNNGKGDLMTDFCSDGTNQHDLLNHMAQYPCAAIIAIGKKETKMSEKGENIVSKIDMKNNLVVSVNGVPNYKDIGQRYPNHADLQNNIPLAVYGGNISGGVLSPTDEEVTNYIVFSGKIGLNPRQPRTDTYRNVYYYTAKNPSPKSWNSKGYTYYSGIMQFWSQCVPSAYNKQGAYRTAQWWKALTPHETPTWDSAIQLGWYPFTESAPANFTAHVSVTEPKMSVLRCMLIVGDKVLVEILKGESLGHGAVGTGNGKIEDFVWRPYKTKEQCANLNEYYAQSFTIGFTLKDGDKVIGTMFDMQNNISHDMGIDADGIAVPIRKSDNLVGKVQFMILGPYDLQLKNVDKSYLRWSWIEDTDYEISYHVDAGKEKNITAYIMPEVSSIFLEEFEVKIYSDNGLVNNTGENDIVYLSNTTESFVNRKDDITFKISSALTAEESRNLNVTDTVKMSTPVIDETGTAINTIYDCNKNQTAKPEQLYVDSYYNEYHLPRVLMTQKMEDQHGGIINLFHHYCHPYMQKTFFVQGISRNLTEGYAELQLKEIDS